MRLFVAVELPDEVRAAVDQIERPGGDDVRWSAPSTWHVTLRFFGDLPDATDAIAALGRVVAPPATAVIGRTPGRVGPTAIALPVAGLDELAAAVTVAFAGLPGEERRPFSGHLTIGRLRRTGRWPVNGVGPLAEEVRWDVGEVALVQSHLGQGPATYEVLARQQLRLG